MAPLTFEQSMQKFLSEQQAEREERKKEFLKGQEELKSQRISLDEQLKELGNKTDEASQKQIQELKEQKKALSKQTMANIDARKQEVSGANEVRSEQKVAIEEQRTALDMMKASIEANGGVAADSKEFQKQELKLKLAELDLRKKQATSRGAKEEIEKERRAAMAKQGSFLQRIAAGIGGMKGLMLDKAKAVGGGLMNILKGTLFAGLFLALAAFFQSPMFGKVIDVLTNTILPGLITVGKFFMSLGERFIQAFSNIQVEFDKVFGPNKTLSERFDGFLGIFKEGGIIAAGLIGIVALLKPGLLFGAIKLGIKLFKGALAMAGLGIQDQAADLKKGRGRRGGRKGKLGRIAEGAKNLFSKTKTTTVKAGKTIASGAKTAATTAKTVGSKVANTGAKAMTGLKAGAKSGARMLAGAARFIPGAGLAVTAAMGIFDGVSAGVEEFKKSGSIGKAVKEGLAGTVSGLTFGLVDQKTVSGAFDFIGGKYKSAFNFLKKQVTGGVDKLKKSGIGGDIEAKQAEIAKIQADLGKTGRARRSAVGFSDKDEKQRIIALQQEINALRTKELQQNARMKAQVEGGTAPININAPSDNKVTTSSTTNQSNQTNIGNADPIVQMAFR